MNKNTGDALLRLRETIDSWTEELTQARSALTESLKSDTDSSTPAFRLIQSPKKAQPAEAKPMSIGKRAPSESGGEVAEKISEANRALMRRVEDLEMNVSEAERLTQETERERARLDAEIQFAREQLHLRNKSAREAEDRRAEHEMQAGEATRALGGAEREIADLRQQLRSKDWRLLKTRNVLDEMREDHARRVADVGALTSQVEALRAEVEERQASEIEKMASLDAARSRNLALEEALEDSKREAEKLETEIQAIWEVLNGRSEQLREAGEEIAGLIAERDDREATLAEMEEQTRAMKEREAAYEERATEAGARADELEGTLASQLQENASLKEILVESSSALDVQLAALKEARDGFAKLQIDRDELMASHTALRDELRELQARLAERDQALEETRNDLEMAIQAKREIFEKEARSTDLIAELSSGMEEKITALEQGRQLRIEAESAAWEQDHELALALEEKSIALEASERTASELREKVEADERLQRALRDELATIREQRDATGIDQASLITALKDELEAMRQVAVERDFVIHHAEAGTAAMGQREAEVEDALKEALAASERMRNEVAEAAQMRKALESELGDLLDQAREKDASTRELNVELKALRERVRRIAEATVPVEGRAVAGHRHGTLEAFQSKTRERLGKALNRVWESSKAWASKERDR